MLFGGKFNYNKHMYTIHKATLKNIPEIKEVLKKTWVATYGYLFNENIINKITSDWHSVERLSQSIKNPESLMLIAKNKSGKIIGLCSTSKNNRILKISRLYVLPKYQKMGIGKKLLEQSILHFKHIYTIALEVEALNTNAIEFYKLQGFKTDKSFVENIEGIKIKSLSMFKKNKTVKKTS